LAAQSVRVSAVFKEGFMTNRSSGSLAARAVLALVLMVGFYLLALVIAALLLFVIYLEISSGHLNIYLALVCLFAAGVILWSIEPRSDRFEAPGPLLEEAKYPRLFTELKSISQATGQKMPAAVYLLPEPNAYVLQAGGFAGLGSRRVLGIGLPLFETLTCAQLRWVLAHEFGHYSGGDTRLGPWVYRTRSMVIRTISGLSANNILMYLIRLPFYGYGKMFLRITLAVSRRQEYNADQLAAHITGASPAIEALRTIHSVAPAWEAYWRHEYAPILGAGYVPPLADVFAGFLKSQPVAQKISEIVTQEMQNAHTDPYDSHPALKDRIAALTALPTGTAGAGDSPAVTLIDNLPQLELALLQPIAARNHLPTLKNISWAEVVRLVYIPGWQKTVQKQAVLLLGMTPEKLPAIASQIDTLVNRLSGVENLTAEQLTGVLFYTVGAALTLAFYHRGWQVNAAPGESPFVYQANQRIECFNILPRLRASTLPADIWINNCQTLGITGIDLSQVTSGSPA
jgi:heat shock protein HtpX